MSLKSSVVVVNQFSTKTASGGTRGGTPGSYITRYMARDGATETVAPIRLRRQDDFILRYMAREMAVDTALSPRMAKELMRSAQKYAGVSFGYGQLSLSHEGLMASSRDVQRLFDEGHTVMKTVISFDEEYLREKGVISPDFTCQKKGDYRGNIDQMKLRMAVMNGLDRMSQNYDDLRYVGVIQVDTMHVHCHLSMVDAGPGKLVGDAGQRGKIDDRDKSLLRRGIDSWLDDKKKVKHLSSAVGYDKRNVTSYMKRWTHDAMLQESLPQFLIACLPQDQRLWRAGSNAEEMRKPNRLVRMMVDNVLEEDPIVMAKAMSSVEDYANTRRDNEGLSNDEWHQLMDRGRAEIIDGCVNSVYSALKNIPDSLREIRTPMLDLMSMDFSEMAELAVLNNGKQEEKEELVDFGFRLRSYSSRLSHHRQQRAENHDKARSWESAQQAGAVNPASRVLHDFYVFEEQYHAQLASKYQYFLPMVPAVDQWYEYWEEVAAYGDRLISLEAMSNDRTIRQLKDGQEAERRGMEIYGQHGGSLVSDGPGGRAVIDSRLESMRRTYETKVSDLADTLADQGLLLAADGTDRLSELSVSYLADRQQSHRAAAEVSPGQRYDFEEVKALDLHALRYDFGSDIEIGQSAVRRFTAVTEQRETLLNAARDYLVDSGQEAQVATLPVADVAQMSRMRDELGQRGDAMLPSSLAQLAAQADRRRSVTRRRMERTTALSAAITSQVSEQVHREVAHYRPEAQSWQDVGPDRQQRDLGS